MRPSGVALRVLVDFLIESKLNPRPNVKTLSMLLRIRPVAVPRVAERGLEGPPLNRFPPWLRSCMREGRCERLGRPPIGRRGSRLFFTRLRGANWPSVVESDTAPIILPNCSSELLEMCLVRGASWNTSGSGTCSGPASDVAEWGREYCGC